MHLQLVNIKGIRNTIQETLFCTCNKLLTFLFTENLSRRNFLHCRSRPVLFKSAFVSRFLGKDTFLGGASITETLWSLI